jgi:hypothetical protein
MKTCVEFAFQNFGSLWYNTWTIVLIACLWLVSSVDTTQAHIYYIYSHPNLSKIKFLANLSLDSGSAETPENFLEISGSQKLRTGPRVSRPLGYIYPFSPWLTHLSPSTVLTGLPCLPSPPPRPHLAPLGDFHFPPSK